MLVPMRDRLILKPLDVSTTPGGLHVVSNSSPDPRQHNMGCIRCRVIAQGDGMLVGETGGEWEKPFPIVDGTKGIDPVTNRNLVGCVVVVFKLAGFEDEDPITREKLLIVTPLDILAVVE